MPRSGPAPTCRSPSAWTRRSRPPSRRSPTTPGSRSSTPTRSTTRPPTGGSPAPKSPRSPLPPSARRRRPTRCPAGGGPPHPRPQRHPGAGHPVRGLALPRLLHHHRPSRVDTVAADKTHRHHAVIEQVHADLKNSALAHLPSVVWSRAGVVHDVRDEGVLLSGVRRGCDYLPLSITEAEGSQCEYSVCSCQVLGSSPGTVLGDDHVPVDPVERFLAYLASIERSPNTVKPGSTDDRRPAGLLSVP